MARRPRIELAGKYHIINRGVAQMPIFKESADYEYFEVLMFENITDIKKP